jgi:hypothetical protein
MAEFGKEIANARSEEEFREAVDRIDPVMVARKTVLSGDGGSLTSRHLAAYRTCAARSEKPSVLDASRNRGESRRRLEGVFEVRKG